MGVEILKQFIEIFSMLGFIVGSVLGPLQFILWIFHRVWMSDLLVFTLGWIFTVLFGSTLYWIWRTEGERDSLPKQTSGKW